MREALERELDRFVTFEMTMCGLVLRGEDRSDAISCAVEHQQEDSASLHFRSAARIQTYGLGLVGNPQGGLQFLVLGFEPPRTAASPCRIFHDVARVPEQRVALHNIDLAHALYAL
jgi:hypothetical protein